MQKEREKMIDFIREEMRFPLDLLESMDNHELAHLYWTAESYAGDKGVETA